MNIKYMTMIMATAAALSACAGSEKAEPATAGQVDAPNSAQAVSTSAPDGTFVCENGMTVKTQYVTDAAGNNRIKLTVDTMQMSAELPQTTSGSGEQYTGQGFYGNTTQWHQKAGMAMFTFSDKEKNTVETSCRAS